MPTEIKVRLKQRGYPVVVGYQVLDQLPRLLSDRPRGSRLFVLYDAQVYALHGGVVRRHLAKSRLKVIQISLPPGERTKSQAQVNRLRSWLLSEEVTRDDMIIAVGGGVVSDLAGFVAATILRGIEWGVITTTLLGQVDAAIGGKTGINHSSGKNLIGAFWQPDFVLADTCFLSTLPQRQVLNGLGEVAKYAGLVGSAMIGPLRKCLAVGDLYDFRLLEPLVVQSVRYKAKVVADDERESGKRMLLNLGHTFGHAIEGSLKYRGLFHGEAVVLGLLAAAELSKRHLGVKSDKLAELQRIWRNLSRFMPRVNLDVARISDYMKRDKKRSARSQKFVLLEAPGRPIIVKRVAPGRVRASVSTMVRYYSEQGGKDA